MFNDKGFIKFKDGDFEVTINYLNKDDYLLGITLGNSNKVEYFKNHPYVAATDGVKGEKFVDVYVEIEEEKSLAREVYDEMTQLKHNHFKEYDEKLVVVKIKLV